MTVLKTMFTAIAVAAVLVALATGTGLLDPTRIWVNPTYLWPGIVGGLVMGVGFVVGGFCPGTSLVAAATLKVDGILFVLGGLVGVYAFGETVASYETFWLSSHLGRFTLPDWLGLSTGATVLLVVAMALGAFRLAESIERRFAPAAPSPSSSPLRRRLRVGGAGTLLLAALVLAARGEPSAEERWRWAPPARHRQVAERAIFVDPAEIVALRGDPAVKVSVLDVRGEHEFNLFHLGGARRVDPAELDRPEELKRLLDEPATTVTLLAGNGEGRALEAWKRLAARGIQNVYVLEGGVNAWLARYPVPECVAAPREAAGGDDVAFRFAYATGAHLPSAWPELPWSRDFRFPCGEPLAAAGAAHHGFTWPTPPFTKRVKLQARGVVKGGCG
jgi:rhodanese-related sulfurtransferase